MANWLVNLNWSFKIEIWKNCRLNGRAAIGWKQWSESEIENVSSYHRASGYLEEMKVGDRIISFLKDRRLGGWGTITKPYDESVFDPQLRPGTKDPDFGRVVHLGWEKENVPPIGQAARMQSDEMHGFAWVAAINPLKEEAFDRLRSTLENTSRWEPIAELSEELETEDRLAEEEMQEEWHAPLRETALRGILARNLDLLEPGLKPYDPNAGPEEVSVGAAG